MTIPDSRSNCIGGFLITAHDFTRGDPHAQNVIMAELHSLGGEPEPEQEAARAAALAMWATHRWATTCLEIAGFERVAELIAETPDAEAAAFLLASPDVDVPMPPSTATPRELDDIAGLAAEQAAGAGIQMLRASGPAIAAKMACEATRKAKANGRPVEPLTMAQEIINAARAAMNMQGPPAYTPAGCQK